MNSSNNRSRPRGGARREALTSRLALETLETRAMPAVAAPVAMDPMSYDPTSVLVRLRDGVSAKAIDGSAESLGGQLYRVTLTEGQSLPEVLAGYAKRSDILFAEPDTQILAQAVPNDPRFSEQWGLHNVGQGGGAYDADIDAPQGWDVSTGRGRTIVAVIDSGIDTTHPDLAANIWRNPGEIPGNNIDDDGDGYIDDVNGWNFLANTANVADDYGHGTHVAGIIGAVGGNGIGVTGVDQHVQLMALKFLNAGGSGRLSDAAKAVNFAVAHGAGVINLSTGGLQEPALQDAIANARAAGVIVVTAAGNQARSTDTYPVYPASYPLDNIVSVAAVDNKNVLASFSNYGAQSVDLAAPGVGILSTSRGGSYGVMSGTSMAAPFVAGAIALIKDLQPTWTYQQVIGQVLSTTSRISGLAGKTATGGVLNFGRALLTLPPPAVGTPSPVPTPVPQAPRDTTGPKVTAATFGGAELDRVRVTLSEAIDPASFGDDDVIITGPAGPVAALSVIAVAGTGNSQFDVSFAKQTASGAYLVAIGPEVRDSAGNAMDQNGNGVIGEATDIFRTATTLTGPITEPTFTLNSTDGTKPIQDFQTTVSTIVVDSDAAIRSLKVRVNVAHTFDSDLIVSLESPSGKRVTLFNRRGGSGDNLLNTLFDDAASTPIVSGAAPFAGSYKPDNPLTVFAGESVRGVWKLTVEDKVRRDTGTLNGWSLTIDGVAAAAARAASVDGSEQPAPGVERPTNGSRGRH